MANFRQHVCFGCAVVHGVDVDDVAIGILVEIVIHEMGADETAPAGDKQAFLESRHFIQIHRRGVYVR
jgi:hypothetical protein